MNNSKYHFQTEEFGISDEGIHLFRSGYNYETILYPDIQQVRVYRGKELNNWLVILLIGLGICISGILLTYRFSQVIFEDNGDPSRYRSGLVALIPIFGGFFIYNSFRTGVMLQIDTLTKTKRLPLREISKAGVLKEFQFFLFDKLKGRIKSGQN
jgi:hypothetical protein